MDKTELLELADRVERAAGPDRELDAEIALVCGIVRERDGDSFYGHRDYSVMVLERGYYDFDGSAPELPAYTASIDAAMTLVPEGLFEKVATGTGTKRAFAQLIWLRRRRGKWGGGQLFRPASIYTNASTPALALCAAALKARASLSTSEEG
jgi:hypothetical protein